MESYVNNDKINPETLHEQYELEKSLAKRLRESSREERRHENLYSNLYDELYEKVPHLTYVKEKNDYAALQKKIAVQMKLLDRYLRNDINFLEIGPGNCGLSIQISYVVKNVIACDVSDIASEIMSIPSNFSLVITDGVDIPVPDNSVDLAYSSQLMEHLHPDDAEDQVKNIFNALTPGGSYICITPNRITGPHDVSKYFDEIATGLHLKEYTYTELANLFRKIGFSKIKAIVATRFAQQPLNWPVFPFKLLEWFITILPRKTSKKMARSRLGPFSLNQVRMIANK